MRSAAKNYMIIWNEFLKYLPSRLFITMNSLVIIPFLAYIMSSREMSVFQICIGILNLLCTCSMDWISKSTLRFWIKYKKSNKLESFYSAIVLTAITSYLIILLIYTLFGNTICNELSINKGVLMLTLFLIIPCAIRQFLYQILRIINKPFLYTFSILIYQFLMLGLFLLLSGYIGNVYSILIAMALAIFIIDFYIIKQINLSHKITLFTDFKILKESLTYSIPTVFTNVSIWGVFHINKFVFQSNKDFLDTATSGVACFFVSGILASIFSTFLFSVFPIIVKQYEKKREIKDFVTATIQLYCAIFIPIVSVFCFYPKILSEIFLSEKYIQAQILLPFFATATFLHELLKLINIKYHLKNKTYVEMIITVLIGVISLILNIVLIPLFKLWAVGSILLFSIILLIAANALTKIAAIDYINPIKIAKTSLYSIATSFASYTFLTICFKNIGQSHYFQLGQIILFLILYYTIALNFKSKILE